jgi:hypothetical protein
MSDAHFSNASLRQMNQRQIRCAPISLTDMAHEDSAPLFASGDVVNVRAAMKCLIATARLGAETKDTIRWRDLAWDANARRVAAIVERRPNDPASLSLRVQRDDGGTRVARRSDAGPDGAGAHVRRAVFNDGRDF